MSSYFLLQTAIWEKLYESLRMYNLVGGLLMKIPRTMQSSSRIILEDFAKKFYQNDYVKCVLSTAAIAI